MGDMYDYHKNTCSSSTSASPSSSSTLDEISLFLNQFLLRSSSPAYVGENAQSLMSSTSVAELCSKNATQGNAHSSYDQSPLLRDGISTVDSITGLSTSSGVFLSSSGTYSSAYMKGSSAANVCSSSVGVSENETDDNDCESEVYPLLSKSFPCKINILTFRSPQSPGFCEPCLRVERKHGFNYLLGLVSFKGNIATFFQEGIDALSDEVPVKAVHPRSSSKRSRAAEVHNLSEKRRRSRINEKLKALQNLIPNSNKTDKASMLDEAIEYLKQLQLQVQMLSMRNGSSLHPMCFPEALQPLQLSGMRMEYGEENRSVPLSMAATLPLHQENPLHSGCGLPNKSTVPDQASVPSPSYTMNSETFSGLEPPILAHLSPFHLKRPSEGTCREDRFQHANHSDTKPSGFDAGTSATVSVSFDMQPSELKDNGSLEYCITGKDQSGAVMRNIEHNLDTFFKVK